MDIKKALLAGSYLGQINGKWVGAQNRKRPNRDIKFSKSQNTVTGKDSIYSKQLKLKEKSE